MIRERSRAKRDEGWPLEGWKYRDSGYSGVVGGKREEREGGRERRGAARAGIVARREGRKEDRSIKSTLQRCCGGHIKQRWWAALSDGGLGQKISVAIHNCIHVTTTLKYSAEWVN